MYQGLITSLVRAGEKIRALIENEVPVLALLKVWFVQCLEKAARLTIKNFWTLSNE